jgi:IS4 transposase
VTYLIDSTSLALTARSATWARFSAEVCGAKAHIVYDPDADQPVYCAVSAANVNDITAAKAMPIAAGATYVFDLGYYDYAWWAALDAKGCRLVTRLKRNTPLTISETRAVPRGGNVLADRIGYLPARQAKNRQNPFQKKAREVQVTIETGKVLRILTNDLDAPAQTIADLYKRRWAIELFFRWVKQTLKITRFLGTSENAIRIQIAVALITFLLLRAAQATQTTVSSPLAFARLIRANLMHRRDLTALLQPPPAVPSNHNQLVLI